MATKYYATDSEIFQVVRSTKRTVTIRPVRTDCETTEVYTCFDYDYLQVARPDDFTTSWLLSDEQNATGKRCKVSDDGSICVNNYWRVYAYPSDGREVQNRNLG